MSLGRTFFTVFPFGRQLRAGQFDFDDPDLIDGIDLDKRGKLSFQFEKYELKPGFSICVTCRR